MSDIMRPSLQKIVIAFIFVVVVVVFWRSGPPHAATSYAREGPVPEQQLDSIIRRVNLSLVPDNIDHSAQGTVLRNFMYNLLLAHSDFNAHSIDHVVSVSPYFCGANVMLCHVLGTYATAVRIHRMGNWSIFWRSCTTSWGQPIQKQATPVLPVWMLFLHVRLSNHATGSVGSRIGKRSHTGVISRFLQPQTRWFRRCSTVLCSIKAGSGWKRVDQGW
eukprot:m.107565 g.107565  ORF g.107565 m.107565 type:complete len:218 (+) comp16929_c0_seq6:280-933(+)